MKAIVVGPDPDRRLSWEDVPDPTVGENEVLLRVHATAVNRADLLQRRGLYPPPPGAPEWLGLEASGIIEQIGPGEISRDVKDWRVGSPACCLLPGGGYAEKVAVHRGLLLPVPKSVSLQEAAALPEAFATAHLNLFHEGGLKSGERVLIHAGASGVGTAAIQLARECGARIATTVGSREKARLVAELGADFVILHAEEDVTARLREFCAPGEASEKGGIDVVLDCVGGEDLAVHLPLLNVGGRWILISLLKGRRANLDLGPLLSRRLRLIGSTLRSRSVEEKARILEALRQDVWPRIERGRVRPVIHAVLPITQAEEAHRILERNENLGKVILRIMT